MKKKISLIAVVLLLVGMPTAALAAPQHWWGSAGPDNLYTTAGNWWSGVGVPSPADYVGQDNGYNPMEITSAMTIYITDITTADWGPGPWGLAETHMLGGSLTVLNDFTVGSRGYEDWGNPAWANWGHGRVTQSAGSIDIAGILTVGGNLISATGAVSPVNQGGIGEYYLYGGQVKADAFAMYTPDVNIPGSLDNIMKIAGGKLLLLGNISSLDPRVVGPDDTPGSLQFLYEADLSGYTTVTASIIEVGVDIKPQSCPNPLNVRGRGVLPVAILGGCGVDVYDIDAASVTLAGVPAIRSSYQDVATPATCMLDDMCNIAARPWTDDRDTQGQARPGWMSQGDCVMKIDYGVTNDQQGVPNPSSGYDYLGNWVGVGGPGGAFTSTAGNVGGFNADNYAGDFDRVPSGPFTWAELGSACLTTCDAISLDVFKTLANSSEHVRELQLYDSLGNRNTYSVQAEGTASTTGGAAGWRTYCVCLSNPLENNADLTDITDIKLWVSSWSAYPTAPNPSWPDDYVVVPRSGTPVLIKNLRLICSDCEDCTTEAGDGFTDLTLKFSRRAVVDALGDGVSNGDEVQLTLTGNLLNCQPIVGSDCVVIRDGKGAAAAKRQRKRR